ncbi:hypothetical protein EGR_02031 [Echinococcus granulosus]|uniref:Uncharacterized protein n=1 Tax=Echinococcus granulosus TaxID=6210 RepID=W6UXF4_ECHGR|nr:hypothetical protein EGR_02031 [Echinococcus granulosus]EUB63227.1 hypothetical protein EGR_02031 [Echinococcus granulosus]
MTAQATVICVPSNKFMATKKHNFDNEAYLTVILPCYLIRSWLKTLTTFYLKYYRNGVKMEDKRCKLHLLEKRGNAVDHTKLAKINFSTSINSRFKFVFGCKKVVKERRKTPLLIGIYYLPNNIWRSFPSPKNGFCLKVFLQG